MKISKYTAFIPLSAAILATVGAMSWSAVAAADPLPYGPNTCVQGFVWREASQYDEVCVTPDTRTATAQQNGLAAQNREAGGGAYGKDTCKQGFVWREAFTNDRVCVTPDVRTQAAADNAAAAARLVINQPTAAPAPKPAQGPGVSFDPRFGGLTAHISDRSGVASQCSYRADFYKRSFFLPANATYDLAIVPALPKFGSWDVTISCDNGTTTHTSTFF